jgi:DNA-binding NarL/FixJ family response regulator
MEDHLVVRVLIVDDHKIMLDAISAYLDKQPDMEVVGFAENGRESLRLTEELLPDVVLMDLMLPELNGIEATRQIASRFPEVKVLVLSGHLDKRVLVEALKAGAKGITMKSFSSGNELITAIRTVAANEKFFSQPITDVIVSDFINQQVDDIQCGQALLSPREREILQLIAEGKNAKEIAFVLELSFKTVNAHRQNIMKKLRLGSIAELTRFAIHEGIVE